MPFDPSSNKTVTIVEVLLFVIVALRNHWINILMVQILLLRYIFSFSYMLCFKL